MKKMTIWKMLENVVVKSAGLDIKKFNLVSTDGEIITADFSDLIQEHVESFRDDRAYSAVVARENREKALLEDLSSHWFEVAEHWDDIKADY